MTGIPDVRSKVIGAYSVCLSLSYIHILDTSSTNQVPARHNTTNKSIASIKTFPKVSVFSGLYTSETLVDVTLAAEGRHIQGRCCIDSRIR